MRNTLTGVNGYQNQQTMMFDSWDEFVRYAENTPSDMTRRERLSITCSQHLQPEYHPIVKFWGGEKDIETAIEKAKRGWKEGAAEITKTFVDFRLPSKRTQKQNVMSIAGPGTLDMGRYVQGHPLAWKTRRNTTIVSDQMAANGGVVQLGINISQTGGQNATERFKVGALILALIDLLERHNRRVELTLYNAVSGKNQAFIRIGVRVKKADSPVNMSILAFAFANAATQRRLCWAIRETMSKEIRGACSIQKNGDMGNTDPNWHENDRTIIKGLGSSQLDNEASRIAWLQAQLKEQGIEWDGK